MIPGYRIIRELGRGGMATVYLAEQESLGREVALKVLNPALAADADFAERFVREARTAAAFRHRHLLPVYDTGRAAEHLFLAMEFVPGGHAGDLRGGDVDEVRRCLIEVASGLAHAHAKGVVHRDIKPENILRREDGSYVLADFGIARSEQATRELTGPQAAIGTPSYMSPEQWRGDAIDGRADLYSLGIVAFELLTGITPFRGADGWSIGMQHMNAARPRLPDALADWQHVLDRLLAIERGERFARASELIAALGGKPEQTPPMATPRPQPALYPTTPLPMPARAPRHRAIAFAVTLALAVSVIGYQSMQMQGLSPDPAADKPSPTVSPASVATNKSVAVLPFRVLSTEPSDGMFADGLSEEILASLAAISELKVPGRTSSFAWKDKSADVREIAKALGVAHVLEGSIRRAGTQLRISASLIDASDGATLWTQTFDRDSGDVFAIQNEIAIAVSDRLAVQIGTRTLPTLARLPAEQRGHYLETIGALRTLPTAGMSALAQSLREIETTGHGGPDLYVRLLNTMAHRARNEVLDYTEVLDEQERYLATLDARFGGSVEALQGKAIVRQTRGDAGFRIDDYEAALDLHGQALARAPNDVLSTTQAAFAARTLLRHEQALDLARRAVAIDPQDPAAHFALAATLGSAGRSDESVAAMRELARRFPDSGYARNMSMFLAGNGQLADAVMLNRDCVKTTANCGVAVRMLRLLGFDGSADAMQAQRPQSARVAADGYDGLRFGKLPDTEYAAIGALPTIESVSEALAQQRNDLAETYLVAGRIQLRIGADLFNTPLQELDMRAALSFVGVALIAAGAEAQVQDQSDLAAVRRITQAMPAKTMPYPTVHWALGAEILSGDMDAAFHRLDGMADLNPLHWQYWVISPSGRDVPTAKILRADPRFAAIWARREALIARERARLKQLWPEVE